MEDKMFCQEITFEQNLQILRQLLTAPFPSHHSYLPPTPNTLIKSRLIKSHKAGAVGSAPYTAAFLEHLNYNFLFLG